MGPNEDHGKLHALPGVDNAVDQVIRLERFRKDHPGVTIMSPRQMGTANEWLAMWDEETGPAMVMRPYLREILDILEKRFSEDVSPEVPETP